MAAFIVACIWVAVIIWWQSSHRQVSPQDALLYLLGLPAAVLATLGFLLWLRARPARKAAAAATAAAATPENQPEAEKPAEQGLPVLAAWSVSSAGASLDELRQTLVEKRRRPQPDAALLDDYGYPLHAARIPDLDTAAAQDALASLAMRNPALAHGEEPREAFLRTLALLTQLLEQVAIDWPLAGDSPEAADAATRAAMATLRGNETPGNQGAPRLQVQVKLLAPADFTPAEQQQTLSFLLDKTAALPVDAAQLHVESLPARDDAAALLQAERFRAEALRAQAPQALLLLACDSALCPSVAERWQAEQRLFGSHAPHGLMPGEAAFAILCINHKAMPLALAAPACALQRVAHARRDVSADAGGKPSHAALDAVVGEALAAARLTGEAIGAIACDADHRSSRVLECIGAMMRHVPQLDAIEHRLALNETCGHTGAASAAGSWAAGIAQVRESASPVLLFNVSHAFERAAAVLLPADGEWPQPS